MISKTIILTILCLFSGIAFIVAGIYFLTTGYLDKLNSASPNTSEKNILRAKTCGYISLGIGALTLMFGIMLFMFPSISSALVLVYMSILLISCIVLMVVYK
mgnify:CR=1 FL=1